MGRKLVLLFDGTWNRRESTTNVWRTSLLLERTPEQLVYYDEGVGTEVFNKLRGGVFGSGLSRKVLNGYLWLMENYRPPIPDREDEGDSIYILGFSRGAFTARSLVGVLGLAGILRADANTTVEDAFLQASQLGQTREGMRWFRTAHSFDVSIRFVGVWDTVGSLGREEEGHHYKVETLDSVVKQARHALALDEFRKDFQPTLWSRAFEPGTDSSLLEQRWFVGAHGNVGGGYEQDGLFRRPLQWIQNEAEKAGLRFRSRVTALGEGFYGSALRDSLNEMLGGAYNLRQWFKPIPRKVAASPGSGQSIDYTVFERWLGDPSYTSLSLQKAEFRKEPSKSTGGVLSLTDAQIIQRMGALDIKLEPSGVSERGFLLLERSARDV